jgi:CheY-like chemotaxis protein
MPKRILLADDSITIQKVVELTFSDGDYEVVAVNNGAKAIQKLSEMRPDIILSDIIMPEKNGYEVCEYVKSHPELRNLPVVLLTGTFEPFDPDRAEKAGCDAVVTKPFESQSLIHKVEELIAASRSMAPTAAVPVTTEETPWAEPDPDATAITTPEPFTHGGDIFSAAAEPAMPTTEMPFDAPPEAAYGGETRAFPRMSFEEMQQMAAQPATPPPAPPAPEPEPSPWDQQAASPFGEAPADAPAFGGETRAFPRMSFEEMQQTAAEPTPAEPAAPEPSPWDAPAEAPAFGGETRAFPRMSFDELQQQMQQPSAPAAAPPPAPEPSPWDEQPAEAPSFGGETRAFPRMSFDELQQQMQQPAPAPPAAPEPPPWEQPAATESPFAQPEPEQPTYSAPEPAPLAAAPAYEPPPWEQPEATPFGEAADAPFAGASTASASDDQPPMTSAPEAAWPAAEPEPMTAVNSQITDDVSSQVTDVNPQITDLSDAQIDRIARRVVQIMSEQVVRNIAWEVIPDMAEMVVKERIRQLEAE